jgi:hypothetical protein
MADKKMQRSESGSTLGDYDDERSTVTSEGWVGAGHRLEGNDRQAHGPCGCSRDGE